MGMYHSKKMTDEQMRRSTDVDCSADPGLTKQEFRDDADINKIVARCIRTGGVTEYVNKVAPVFEDVSSIGDFSDCMRRVQEAKEAFMELPAAVRSEFDNDPAKAVAFIQDPRNLERAVELGLVVKREAPKEPPKEAPKADPK